MANEMAAAILSLLAGGTQGFAEARKRRKAEQIRESERQQTLDIQRQQFEEEQALKESEARSAAGYRRASLKAGKEARIATVKSRADIAAATAAFREKELGLEKQRLTASTTIEQLQAKVAGLQASERTWDPHKSIAETTAEVYKKIATGDTPEIAGQEALKASIFLTKTYQALGLIPGQYGPEAPSPPAAPEPSISTGSSILEGGPSYFQFPGGNNPIFLAGGGQLAFGKRAAALAESLRTLGNAKR